jgi:hypothetical protein
MHLRTPSPLQGELRSQPLNQLCLRILRIHIDFRIVLLPYISSYLTVLAHSVCRTGQPQPASETREGGTDLDPLHLDDSHSSPIHPAKSFLPNILEAIWLRPRLMSLLSPNPSTALRITLVMARRAFLARAVQLNPEQQPHPGSPIELKGPWTYPDLGPVTRGR